VTHNGFAIYVIGGSTAARSTVARLLAARFEAGVHVEGDAGAAERYLESGFTVALEALVAPALLGDYRAMIHGRPCHVVVLHDGAVSEVARVGVWIDVSDLTHEQTVDAILARTPTYREPIVIADYDRGWPSLFQVHARLLRAAVAELGAEIEHVGSTAVAGLAAKPIIDIDVVVRSAADVPVAIERLRALGYVYQGDKGLPGREAFLWPPGTRRHHAYVVVSGSHPHANHTAFRDYLREHPQAAAQYAELKRELAERYRDDERGYGQAKDEFVADVLRMARAPDRRP
jgi:GrpB-like predicted nucleotidyltransferase (UPF0157 family)